MRNRRTNFLQIIVLITGLVYIFIGMFYFISPATFAKILQLRVNQDWLNNVHLDEFLFMIYTFSRIVAVILLTSGLGMILPLFDPLKYRGLIYCNGVIFQLISASYLLFAGITRDYQTILAVGILLALLFIMTIIGLLITKSDANSGIE